jgi:hypothetical protein
MDSPPPGVFVRAARIQDRVRDTRGGPDVIHEALDIGAQGYIHKTRARHLLPVVESVLDGSPAAARHGHQAQFGSDETTMLEAAECFLGSTLHANDAAVAVTTWPHTRQLLERLRNRGADIDAAIARGSFVQVDAGELASRLLLRRSGPLETLF